MTVGSEVEQGMGNALGGGGVIQTGLVGDEQGGVALCSGDCIGVLVGGGEVQ